MGWTTKIMMDEVVVQTNLRIRSLLLYIMLMFPSEFANDVNFVRLDWVWSFPTSNRWPQFHERCWWTPLWNISSSFHGWWQQICSVGLTRSVSSSSALSILVVGTNVCRQSFGTDDWRKGWRCRRSEWECTLWLSVRNSLAMKTAVKLNWLRGRRFLKIWIS